MCAESALSVVQVDDRNWRVDTAMSGLTVTSVRGYLEGIGPINGINVWWSL